MASCDCRTTKMIMLSLFQARRSAGSPGTMSPFAYTHNMCDLAVKVSKIATDCGWGSPGQISAHCRFFATSHYIGTWGGGW